MSIYVFTFNAIKFKRYFQLNESYNNLQIFQHIYIFTINIIRIIIYQ